MRTYLYKIISDRGGAPCAPTHPAGGRAVLTLAICKPAIRRTAQPGNRLIGIASRALESREGYAPAAVIFAGVVAESLDARAYYAPDSPFRYRPDCIYLYQPEDDSFLHAGRSALHAHPEHRRKDLGSRLAGHPNGRVLLLRRFRYFGPAAKGLPGSMRRLHAIAAALGQGHRRFDSGADPLLDAELEQLFGSLMRRRGTHSPSHVQADAYDHVLSSEARGELRSRKTDSRASPCNAVS